MNASMIDRVWRDWSEVNQLFISETTNIWLSPQIWFVLQLNKPKIIWAQYIYR